MEQVLKDKGVKTKQISNKSGFWGLNNNTHFVYYFKGDAKNYFGLRSKKMRALEDEFNKNVLSVDSTHTTKCGKMLYSRLCYQLVLQFLQRC